MNKKGRCSALTQAGIIAALYVVLTYLAAGFDLASGAVQVRVSEALTILPYFTQAAIPGLTIGCFLANLLVGSLPSDIVFGTLATLLGALGTRALRNNRYLCALPPVVSNMLLIPFILSYAYHIPGSIPLMMLTVGLGEFLSCFILGELLIDALRPFREKLF